MAIAAEAPHRPPTSQLATPIVERALPNDPSIAGSNACPEDEPRIEQISPSQVQESRYRPNHLTDEQKEDTYDEISPWEFLYPRGPLPNGWNAVVHPEGKRYFVYNVECEGDEVSIERESDTRVLTHINLYDKGCWDIVEAARISVLKKFSSRRIPPETDIVIEILDDEEFTWGYYAVNWEKQLVFWPESAEVYLITRDQGYPYSNGYLQLAAKWQFWIHVDTFPTHRCLPQGSISRLKSILQGHLFDILSSESSTAPYDETRLDKYLDIVKGLEKNEPEQARWITGRLMASIAESQLHSLHGEHEARLDRTESVYESSKQRPDSIGFGLISMLLFDGPHACMVELEKLYVDKSVSYTGWSRLIGKLQEDWTNSMIPITVLLGANMGFLAVPNISTTSFASTLSGVSTVFCLGSILICCVLMRNFPHYKGADADPILQSLLKREESWFGLRGLATAFSLPLALFLWSLLFFVIGLLSLFFGAHVPASKWTLTTAIILIFCLISLVLIMDHPDPWATLSLRQRLWKRARKLTGQFSQQLTTSIRKRWNSSGVGRKAGAIADTIRGFASCLASQRVSKESQLPNHLISPQVDNRHSALLPQTFPLTTGPSNLTNNTEGPSRSNWVSFSIVPPWMYRPFLRRGREPERRHLPPSAPRSQIIPPTTHPSNLTDHPEEPSRANKTSFSFVTPLNSFPPLFRQGKDCRTRSRFRAGTDPDPEAAVPLREIATPPTVGSIPGCPSMGHPS